MLIKVLVTIKRETKQLLNDFETCLRGSLRLVLLFTSKKGGTQKRFINRPFRAQKVKFVGNSFYSAGIRQPA